MSVVFSYNLQTPPAPHSPPPSQLFMAMLRMRGTCLLSTRTIERSAGHLKMPAELQYRQSGLFMRSTFGSQLERLKPLKSTPPPSQLRAVANLSLLSSA